MMMMSLALFTHDGAPRRHVQRCRARVSLPHSVGGFLRVGVEADGRGSLQVLTPLSLLINIATVFVCAAIVRPSICA